MTSLFWKLQSFSVSLFLFLYFYISLSYSAFSSFLFMLSPILSSQLCSYSSKSQTELSGALERGAEEESLEHPLRFCGFFCLFVCFVFVCLFVCLAAPVACGSSWAGDRTGTAEAT